MIWRRTRQVFGQLVVIKFAVLLLPIGLGLWLLQQNLLLGAKVSYVFHPGQHRGIIQPSDSRSLAATLLADGNLEWEIASDMVDFVVTPARSIRNVVAEIDLVNTNQRLIFFSGVLPNGQRYRQRLVHWKFLNELSWPHITNDGITIWQRPSRVLKEKDSRTGKVLERIEPVQQYSDYQALLQASPQRVGIAGPGFDAYAFFRVPNYRPQSAELRLPHALRGTHTIRMYAEKETLRLSFNKVDLNRAPGKDPLTVTLTQGETTFIHTVVEDDGNTSNNGRVGSAQKVSVEIPDVSRGVYEVKIATSEDVLIRDITSPQTQVAFLQRVFLADGPAYQPKQAFEPVQLSTSGTKVTFETIHAEGLQTIQQGKKRRRLSKVREPLEISFDSGSAEFAFERGDVNVTTDGVIGLAPFTVFAATPKTALLTEPDLEEFDYLVALYDPSSRGDVIRIEQNFSGPTLDATDNSMRFRLEAPGLRRGQHQLSLRSVNMHLERFPFNWARLGTYLRRLLPV